MSKEHEGNDYLMNLIVSSSVSSDGMNNISIIKEIEKTIYSHTDDSNHISTFITIITNPHSFPTQCRLLSTVLLKNLINKTKSKLSLLDINKVFYFLQDFIRSDNYHNDDPRIIIQLSILCGNLCSYSILLGDNISQ
jgi:hypothetical protein